MHVEISAYKLLRLLEVTYPHSDAEYAPTIHGIRLDSDGHVLHAVASDRYTLAVARTGLTAASEPWALTIARPDVDYVIGWLQAMPGHQAVELSPGYAGMTLVAGEHAKIALAARGDEYVPWRDFVRTALANPLNESPVTSLQTNQLARWKAVGHRLQVWQSAHDKAMVLAADDFIGLQMPVNDKTRRTQAEVIDEWTGSLGDGNDTAALLPPRPDSTKATAMDTEALHDALRSSWEASDADTAGPLFTAWIHAGVNAWVAHRFLAALRAADPNLAERTALAVSEELDDGAIGEFAYDAAEKAGHNPIQWQADHEAAKEKKQAAAS